MKIKNTAPIIERLEVARTFMLGKRAHTVISILTEQEAFIKKNQRFLQKMLDALGAKEKEYPTITPELYASLKAFFLSPKNKRSPWQRFVDASSSPCTSSDKWNPYETHHAQLLEAYEVVAEFMRMSNIATVPKSIPMHLRERQELYDFLGELKDEGPATSKGEVKIYRIIDILQGLSKEYTAHLKKIEDAVKEKTD